MFDILDLRMLDWLDWNDIPNLEYGLLRPRKEVYNGASGVQFGVLEPPCANFCRHKTGPRGKPPN